MNIHACVSKSSALALVAAIAVNLAACSSSRKSAGLFPPDPPTDAAVATEQRDLDQVWRGIPGGTDGEKAVYFVNAGFKRVEEECGRFFSATARLQSETSFAKDTLTSAASAAGVIASLATAPTTVLTGIFGASGLFPKVVDDFNQIFLFASVSDELSGQIKSALEDHSSQNSVDPPSGASFCVGTSDCQRKATKLVHDHAYFCTISNLKHVVKTSVANSCVTSAPPSGAPATGGTVTTSNCPGSTPPEKPAAKTPAGEPPKPSSPPAKNARVIMRSGPVMMLAPQ
jgi:hypothetical protein